MVMFQNICMFATISTILAIPDICFPALVAYWKPKGPPQLTPSVRFGIWPKLGEGGGSRLHKKLNFAL